MDWAKPVFLPQTGGGNCVRAPIVVAQTDEASAFRLGICWQAALDALALANLASQGELTHRAARIQAEKALDVYFAALDACLTHRLI